MIKHVHNLDFNSLLEDSNNKIISDRKLSIHVWSTDNQRNYMYLCLLEKRIYIKLNITIVCLNHHSDREKIILL